MHESYQLVHLIHWKVKADLPIAGSLRLIETHYLVILCCYAIKQVACIVCVFVNSLCILCGLLVPNTMSCSHTQTQYKATVTQP